MVFFLFLVWLCAHVHVQVFLPLCVWRSEVNISIHCRSSTFSHWTWVLAGLPALSARISTPGSCSGAGHRLWSSCFHSKHRTHWPASQPLSFLTSWKTACLVLRILCIPLSKFTNCFHVFRFTKLCIVWHAHSIFRKEKKALKCVESEKWSYLEKKKELILAHQFMRVKESRQLSVCVCVSVICFSLKFHVSVRRNWIQRWFPHCVSAVRRASVSYYPVHVTRDDT